MQCHKDGGVRSKIIEGLGALFFEPEGYKIEPLLTKWQTMIFEGSWGQGNK